MRCTDNPLDRWYLLLATVMGLGPRRTVIRISDQTLTVKHGWAFAIKIPLTRIRSAVARAEKPLAWGVHASTTGWLVNGSRGVGGLQLSVTDPDGLIAALPHNAA
ncbi:hypothetical protein ACFWE3_13255 [Mycobacteriaceae bacterium NPDC060252]